MILNIFYGEPDPDRWLPMDRYPRRWVRRALRGVPRPGGQKRVFLNLCAGLDRLGVEYRVNDYRHIKAQPDELACIIGKPCVLDKLAWRNPILFGAAVSSHPLADPDLLTRLPIRKVLVPGEWMRRMCEPFWGDRVAAWPVGIDTDYWQPAADASKDIDFLLYDKVRWEHERYEVELIEPIRAELARRRMSIAELRYGYYREEHFAELLQRCRAMVFLCEHETQGLAYQQALASDVPILAWDRGGFWQDPEFYPERVRFEPVTSVPLWDDRCGTRFTDTKDFAVQLDVFWNSRLTRQFAPRAFVMENITLELGAQGYIKFVHEVTQAECELGMPTEPGEP